MSEEGTGSMTLWVLCDEHGEKGPHSTINQWVKGCPGGRLATREDLIEALGDALVILRDADGNWPLNIIDALNRDRFDGWVVQATIEGAVNG